MNGTHLTLGLVGALAAAGALSVRGSRSTIHEEVVRLRGRIEKLRMMDDEDLQYLIDDLQAKLEGLESMLPQRRAGAQADRKAFALRCAEKLVEFIRLERGSPSQVNVWSRDGVGVRVYFPGGQYLSVGQDGSMSEVSRGKATFLWSGLYPSQRSAVRAAVSKYYDWLRLTLGSEAT